jgi:hypothetical protein
MANGTIAFDTLQTSGQIDGTARSIDTDYLLNGSAKMWCTHTQAGTYVLDDSFNVASIADNGTGETTVTFSNAPANANYTSILTAGSGNNIRSVFNSNNTTRVKVESYQVSSNSTAADAADTCLAVFGELA